jgi:threonyl-tRNA synthetase
MDYAREVATQFAQPACDANSTSRNEKIGYKIRDWEMHKVPYMLVVGEKESTARGASLRRHKEGDLGFRPLEDIVRDITTEIHSKSL